MHLSLINNIKSNQQYLIDYSISFFSSFYPTAK